MSLQGLVILAVILILLILAILAALVLRDNIQEFFSGMNVTEAIDATGQTTDIEQITREAEIQFNNSMENDTFANTVLDSCENTKLIAVSVTDATTHIGVQDVIIRAYEFANTDAPSEIESTDLNGYATLHLECEKEFVVLAEKSPYKAGVKILKPPLRDSLIFILEQ